MRDTHFIRIQAIDSSNRYTRTELLRIWERQGITMVMVTHDAGEAVFLSDRVVVLEPRPGRIKDVVEVSQAEPRNRSSANYIAYREAILGLLGDH